MRCADTTLASWATSNSASTSTAFDIVGQSLVEPITTPTSGDGPRSLATEALTIRTDLEDHALALDLALVVVALVLLSKEVDVVSGLRPADGFDHLTSHLGVHVRPGVLPHGHGDSRVGLDRLELGAMHLGVDQHVLVIGVDPHHVRGDLPVGKVHADGAEVLAVGCQLLDRGFEHAGDPNGRRRRVSWPPCERRP